MLAMIISVVLHSVLLVALYSHITDSLIIRPKRAVTALEDRLWPNATIHYKFDWQFSEELKEMIMAAMRSWQNKTCIKFVEKSRGDTDFVAFSQKGCGCCSSIGRVGGKQTLSLASYCATVGTAMHELGHVIGFWHEHTRPDRGNHVKVRWEHIIEEKRVNFEKREWVEIDSHGRPYDFNSIMHYNPRTFSDGGGDTMVKISGEKIYQNSEISDEDALQARLLYGCPEPFCGKVIEGTELGVITSSYHPNPYLPNQDCVWSINLPPEHHIYLEFEAFNLQDGYKCSSDYLEIREVNKSGVLIGQFCGSGRPPPIISLNSLWIKFHSDWRKELSGFKAVYKIKSPSLLETFEHLENTARQSSVINRGCIQVAREKSGIYSSLNLPNGRSTLTAHCSLLISAPNSSLKQEGIQVLMDTSSSRAYGPNCLGDVFVPDYANEHHYSLWSFENFNDGLHPKWTQLWYDCVGRDSTIELFSETSTMLIVWSSDLHSVLDLKYYIDYDECLTEENKCEQVCENTVQGYMCSCYAGYALDRDGFRCKTKDLMVADRCEVEIDSVSGVVLSSTEPIATCTYSIRLPGYKILLDIVQIRLPAPLQCDKNYIEFTSNKKTLAYTCTNMENVKLEGGELITIQQYADISSLQRLPFFKVNYTAFLKQKESCLYEAVGSGSIESDGFPAPYQPNINCVYKLKADTGKRVLLNITHMDIEKTEGCNYDRLRVLNGRRRTSSLITSLCGKISGYVAISSGQHLTLQFLTDSAGSGQGFTAFFSSVN